MQMDKTSRQRLALDLKEIRGGWVEGEGGGGECSSGEERWEELQHLWWYRIGYIR